MKKVCFQNSNRKKKTNARTYCTWHDFFFFFRSFKAFKNAYCIEGNP